MTYFFSRFLLLSTYKETSESIRTFCRTSLTLINNLNEAKFSYKRRYVIHVSHVTYPPLGISWKRIPAGTIVNRLGCNCWWNWKKNASVNPKRVYLFNSFLKIFITQPFIENMQSSTFTLEFFSQCHVMFAAIEIGLGYRSLDENQQVRSSWIGYIYDNDQLSRRPFQNQLETKLPQYYYHLFIQGKDVTNQSNRLKKSSPPGVMVRFGINWCIKRWILCH